MRKICVKLIAHVSYSASFASLSDNRYWAVESRSITHVTFSHMSMYLQVVFLCTSFSVMHTHTRKKFLCCFAYSKWEVKHAVSLSLHITVLCSTSGCAPATNEARWKVNANSLLLDAAHVRSAVCLSATILFCHVS